MSEFPRGLIAPNLTPFEDDLSVATDLYVSHARHLLQTGCAGLAPFGTTGEALSVGIDERIETMRAMREAGLPMERMIPGTGLTSLADTVRLGRACLDLGCAGVMVLPPFYYKTVAEVGLHAYFAALVAELGPAARICLYHIPRVSGVGLPPSLVARLRADFPEQIVAIKDSSGDADNLGQLLEIPGLTVYPGSELLLEQAMARGGPGCITATANLNAPALAEHVAALAAGQAEASRADAIRSVRLTLQASDMITGQKRLLALASGDARWANVRPPFLPMPEEEGRRLRDELAPHLDLAPAA